MVVQKRFRGFVLWLALYGVAGSASYYFIYHAHNGNRGLETRESLTQSLDVLDKELQAQQAERERWQIRVNALRSEHVDRDLLDERGRIGLGRVQRGDVIIMDQPRTKTDIR
jgi:hypothetical protein